jgi:hypothetical protein
MARTEAPQDLRPYVRVMTDLPLHPKLAPLDNPAAGWTYVVSLCYCGQSLTDGHFPVAAVLRLAGTDKDVAEALVEQGLWHLPGHDCEECDQPRSGQAVVHDYLKHQRSSAEARDLSEKRREAGRRGAKARWGSRSDDADMANAMANAMPSAEQVPWQNDGNVMAEESRGEKKREEKNKKTSSSSRRRTDEPPRPDVDRLCAHLVDKIVSNGSRRPTITKAWRDAARLMLDRDGRTVEQVIKAIDWCQRDEFWRVNILSMPTLREKYDRLRLSAQRSATNQPYENPQNEDDYDAWKGPKP